VICFAVSRGAQEVFQLLPHVFVEPSELQTLVLPGASMSQVSSQKHVWKNSSANKFVV
jgi:hypothetical protein